MEIIYHILYLVTRTVTRTVHWTVTFDFTPLSRTKFLDSPLSFQKANLLIGSGFEWISSYYKYTLIKAKFYLCHADSPLDSHALVTVLP